MKVFACGFAHETHTFSSRLTPLEDFAGNEPGSIDAQPELANSRSIEGGILSAARQFGWDLTFPFFAQATPSGPVTLSAFETLSRRLLDSLRAMGQVDGVFLPLHGSMYVEGYPDSEGEIIARVRRVVGPDVPIGVLLDLHANVSEQMAREANIISSYRTTPHADHWETTMRVGHMLDRAMRGEIQPQVAVARLPMMAGLDMGRTIDPNGPMCTLQRLAREMEQADPSVLDISLNAGFYYGDVHDAGPSVTITANGLTEQHRALARRLMRLAWDTRDYVSIVHYRVPEAVERAQARLNATPAPMGPVVLADYTDGPMGGGHGDGTELLAALLAVDLPGTVVGPIYDPESVKLACNVPLGESLELEIGGKQDPEYGGGPVHVTARVEAFSDGSYVRRGPYATGSTGHMGRSVLVSVGNVKVLLVSLRCQPEDQEQFRIVGIEAREQRLLALKGINHFRADFEPIASEIIFVDSGGLVSVDFTRFPFRHVRRPIWPLDPDVTLPDEA